jgi:hypothetical protein
VDGSQLGAAYVAESATDYLAYASLYQWGRLSDGHQLIRIAVPLVIVNGSTTTKSTTTPANAFITSGSDWRSTQNDGLWQAGSRQQSLSCWVSRSTIARVGGGD